MAFGYAPRRSARAPPRRRPMYSRPSAPSSGRSGRRPLQWQVGAAAAAGRVARGVYNAARSTGVKRSHAYAAGGIAGVGAAVYEGTRRPRYAATAGGSSSITRSKATIGRYPALKPNRLLKLIKCGMTDRKEIFQGITNFDTNCGYFTIANRSDSTTGVITQPLHVYHLTGFYNNGDQPQPFLGRAFGWYNAAATAPVEAYSLAGMSSDGTGLTGDWTPMVNHGPISSTVQWAFPNADRILHEYTNIKMNLYGARARPTWFNVDIVQVRNEHCNFASADPSHPRFKELISALTSSHTFSNLQTRDTSALKYLKFIKRFKYYIPAEQSTDLNTATGNIKEVKIFVRHGRILNMTSHESKADLEIIPHEQVDGGDYEKQVRVLNTCADSAQMFVIVRAWSPVRYPSTTAQWSTAGTNYTPLGANVWNAKPNPAVAGLDCPSYDMVMTRQWTSPS